MMDAQQAAYIVSYLASISQSLERIANAIDPNTGGHVEVITLDGDGALPDDRVKRQAPEIEAWEERNA